ncbi:hypothetical protein [Mycobacterium sp. E802]|uniref:hypothetical protein n=1 Tax=Mycobacterium sp. E802 TaxID=1834152 RepID=UPI0018D45083|nr:hypothetical protein [Mycobacterium sp. E802]
MVVSRLALSVLTGVTFGFAAAPPAAADSFGPPDFNGYCNYKHHTNLIYAAGPASLTDADSWKCTIPPGIPTDDVDVNAACRWKYGDGAVAHTDNPKWPHSWQCVPAGPPSSSNIPLKWKGTWTSAGTSLPATLNLTSVDPIQGSIEVVGLCAANWGEVQRNSDTSRRVHASVTGGPCIDNEWDLLIDNRSITGQDASGRNANFAFLPA